MAGLDKKFVRQGMVLERGVLAKVKVAAAMEGISLSQLVRRILQQEIERIEHERGQEIPTR